MTVRMTVKITFQQLTSTVKTGLKSIPKVFGSSTAMEMLSIVKTVKGYSPPSISVELSEKLLIFDMIDFELTILAPCVVDKGLALMRAI